jgi:hypothetical protein
MPVPASLHRRLCALIAPIALATALPATVHAARIGFETPVVVDPIHPAGEPDVGVDRFGRVFVSAPTGTGTQRSVWYGSVDRGHSFRAITPARVPDSFQTFPNRPGGGDTDLAFDRAGKQYFSDLFALTCLRSATTADGGRNVQESFYPAGCAGFPGSDRQWLAIYDPAPGTPHHSPYKGGTPLIYQEYNNLDNGAQWVKSRDGLNYANAQTAGNGVASNYSPFGADGYPAIDQVTGKVFQAAGKQDADGKTYDVLLNIGTPNAAGQLTFLDNPALPLAGGDQSKLIHVADHLPGSPDVLFTVLSMDRARNLHIVYAVDADADHPGQRQVYVSAASPASGWRHWAKPVRVSNASTRTGDAVNVFPWIQAGSAGRADAVWYGSNKRIHPSTHAQQRWNVFLSQVVWRTGPGGAVDLTRRPRVRLVKVSPHPAHYDDICLEGSACVSQQGNRNLADFFQVKADRAGAAEIVYDDTSNGLVQPGGAPGGQQDADHAGAAVITLARQTSGMGLFGRNVRGPSRRARTSLGDGARDARYPVIGGTNVPGLDIRGVSMRLAKHNLYVRMKVVDLRHPATTAARVPSTQFLQYVTRWQMGNTLYYAAFATTPAGARTFYAGTTQSIDLCSVSACDPHVLVYPEPGFAGGHAEAGRVSCPRHPSARRPCNVTVRVRRGDIGSPGRRPLLEEVGTYALTAAQQQGATTNANAQADNVPLEVDGACCFNFRQPRPRHHHRGERRP